MNQRYKRTEELNQQIFDRILQLYDNKTTCSIGTIKNSYNKLLPEKKIYRYHQCNQVIMQILVGVQELKK